MVTILHDPVLLLDLESKTAIITGGAGGIGAETVRLFHEHGAKVVIADLPSAKSAAEALVTGLSSRVAFIPTDISDWDSMQLLFKLAREKFGPVQVVVANAGLMETKSFFDFEEDEQGDLKESKESYKVIDVNMKGTMNTLRLSVYHMSSNDPCFTDGSRGSVILVSSTSGYVGGTSVVSYVSSKHGITGLLRASQKAATEKKVRINAVAPFVTPTHITSSYSEAWNKAGLLENAPSDVARAIAQTAMDVNMKGRCCLVVGSMMKEIEGPGEKMRTALFGEEVVEQMKLGGEFFENLGGYPLPPARRKDSESIEETGQKKAQEEHLSHTIHGEEVEKQIAENKAVSQEEPKD